MHFAPVVLLASALSTAVAHPHVDASAENQQDALAIRDASSAPDAFPDFATIQDDGTSDLERRKGGGGRGGSSGSSGSSSGSSSSGSSSSGSSSSSSSSSGSRGSSGSSSGSTPSYAGAYAGGARGTYASGGRTPGGLAPLYIGGAAGLGLGAAAAGSYAYYNSADRVTYLNQTSGQNETHPLRCYCSSGSQCSCDRDPSQAYVNSIVGNGSYAAMMENGLTKVGNGTLYVDGTVDSDDTSAASSLRASGQTTNLALAAVMGAAWYLI